MEEQTTPGSDTIKGLQQVSIELFLEEIVEEFTELKELEWFG